jgi:hypothetical protein
MKFLLTTALASALLLGASAASAAIIFETGADGPANKNVDWIEEAAGNGDNLIEGFINGTTIGVRAEGDEDLKTTGNGGVVWITGNADGNLRTLTYSLVGYSFASFEVDLKDPTGNNPTWEVTFETDDGSTETFTNFNGGFVSAYTDDATLIKSVTFTTNADITGTGQTRFGGMVADTVVPEPGTWALMIMGFGGAGAMLRRRRTALA